MNKIKRIVVLSLIAILSSSYSLIASAFVIREIRVNGLHRIPLSTVLSYLPTKQGENLEPSQTAVIIQELYNTGFFSNVNIGRQGDDLIIQVVERPVIGAIRISGNKEIKTPDLLNGLKKAGIAEGLSYDTSVLEAMKRSLEQQYNSQGRYAAQVKTIVTNESENRVRVNIEITEGKVSKIKELHIVGNKAFSERKLLRIFKSSKTQLWSFFTSNDQFVREKFDADLDQLRAFYMDRGYLKFKINSSQVNMSPDKKKVSITINIEEGPIYRISNANLTGEFFGQKAVLQKLILVRPGQVFSRKLVLTTREFLEKYLANQGYALAEINIVPQVNDENHTVYLTFEISAGKQVYVRRINFMGNYKTTDEVLRRELRQMEGALYSAGNIEESKRRLANLGYLQNVQVKATPVPGNPNLVDLEYQVTEISSATANFQVGLSDAYGLLYGANLNQTNFLGTGRIVSMSFQQNQAATNININYYNPYYTMSGIGRGFTLSSQYANPGKMGISPFRINTYGAAFNYDIPITAYSRLSFAFGYDFIRLFVNQGASREIENFVREHGNRFDQFKTTLGWSRSTYDRAIFPTRGWKQFFGVNIGLPFTHDSLDYYKISYDTAYYHPIVKDFIFHARAQLGYGNGYGNTGELPFFRNFYAGGIDSVRGYDDNTLGPRDSNNDPIGGNILTVGSISLIFPNPFPDQLRTSIFVDAGNVFHNDINGKIRTATGIQFEWVSPMGPLRFAISKALNPGEDDETKGFQFSLGASF
jgi:outer membrane protein insertion porin family